MTLKQVPPNAYYNPSLLYPKMLFAETQWPIRRWSSSSCRRSPRTRPTTRPTEGRDVERVLVEGHRRAHQAKAKALWIQVQKIQYERGGYIGWTNPTGSTPLSKKVRGSSRAPQARSATIASWTLARRVGPSARELDARGTLRRRAAGLAAAPVRGAAAARRRWALFVASARDLRRHRAAAGGRRQRRAGPQRRRPPRRQAAAPQLALDRPAYASYADWISGLAHGDLGDSAVGMAQGGDECPDLAADLDAVQNSLILAGSRRCS